MTIQDLIDAANDNTSQNYFESRPDFWALAPFQHKEDSSLDSGLLNIFNFTHGLANCTDAWAVVGEEYGVAGAVGEDSLTSIVTWKPQRNVWSCAFYTNLTRDFRASVLPAANTTFLLDNKVDTSLGAATAVTSFLSSCLDAWCRNSKSCGAQSCLASQLALDNSTLSAQDISSCIADICSVDANRSSNADISGIGVLISIAIQFSITLVACFLAPYLYMLWNKQHGIDLDSNDAEAEAIKRRVGLPIATFLDDFQRAQCCFSIGINVASLVILERRGPSITQADKDAIALSTYTGTIPTTVIFTALMVVRRHLSLYTALLTLATWLTTLTVRYLPQERSSDYASSGYYGPPPAACGSQPPTYLCDFPLDAGGGVRHFPLLSAVGGVSMLVAVIVTLVSNTLFADSEAHHDRNTPRRRRDLRLSCHLLAVLDFVVSTAMFIWYYQPYISGGFVSTEWTFGQVIALAVWLPTLLSTANDGIEFLVRRRRAARQTSRTVHRGDGNHAEDQLRPHMTESSNATRAVGLEPIHEKKKKPSVRVTAASSESDSHGNADEAMASGANGGTRADRRNETILHV